MSQRIQKCKYIPKLIEMIFNLHKTYNSVVSHVISHNLNQNYEPFEKFDNFHVINGLF
jgi:hypothetical protein